MLSKLFNYLLIGLLASSAFGVQLYAKDATRYKPFVLASSSAEANFEDVVNQTKSKLSQAQFQLLGEFTPYKDTFVKNAHVLVVTNDDLLSIAKKSTNGGFAAPWRIAITESGDKIEVSYINPIYLQYAYRLSGDLNSVSSLLEQTLGKQSTFGSKNGLSARKLSKYHYMMGMERFHNVYLLAKHASHAKALEVLEANLATNQHGLGKVYRLDLDDHTSVFGISRKGPEERYKYLDDNFIMQTVDFKEHKGTAYLPYEIMVKDDQIIALHMRYRMALHYPDLSMMGKHSFMSIRPSPNEIAWGFSQIAKSADTDK